MRGSPLLRAVVVFASLVVFGAVLARVAPPGAGVGRDAAGQAQVEGARVAGSGDVSGGDGESWIPLQLTGSSLLKNLELKHLGKVVWSSDQPFVRQTISLKLPFPAEGIELGARVEWQGGGPNALRIQVTAPDGAELDRTVWGENTLETILPFP